MSKILITGGAGFIGSNLADYLSGLGHEIVICDAAIDPATRFKPYKIENKDVCLYMKELETIEHLPGIFEPPKPFDVIYHLAATPRFGLGLQQPELVLANNTNSLIAALGYCRQHKNTKLIFSSSSSVVWADVTINPYAASKHICEQLIHLYNSTFQTKAVIARLFNVYGAGESDYGSYTTLLKKCKIAFDAGSDFTIYGDGSISRDFTHISDIVTGLTCILKEMESETNLPIYELGFGTGNVTVKQVVEAMLGSDWTINYLPKKDIDPLTTKSKKSLRPRDWKPEVKVLEYIEYWIETGRQND